MAKYASSTTVHAPADIVYDQWNRIEGFPNFMEFVSEVRRLDEERFYWKMQIGAVIKEWEAIIHKQIPNEQLWWKSISKTKIAGGVTLEALDEYTTRITLFLDYTPENFVESLGESLGIIGNVLESDLHNFKAFIEEEVEDEVQLAREVGA